MGARMLEWRRLTRGLRPLPKAESTMPILKRELDQYPPDLMQTEFESLELARGRLQQAQADGAGCLPIPKPQSVLGSSATCTLALEDELDRDPAKGELGWAGSPVGSKLTAASEHDSMAQDLGSFGYFAEYMGHVNAPKPLTFWSGDWDDYPEFDPRAVGWWCLYTHSRQEKALMRHLAGRGVAFYCPMIEKRARSPQGRIRSSYLPLFTNYVFLRGTDDDRRLALTTNCILTSRPIRQPDFLVRDLWQINRALLSGIAITAEQKLTQGDPVIVKSGPFKGFEGFVLRRAGTTRFLIHLRYLEQGVSMEIDEGALAAI